ncbi:MAG: amidase [Lachnospiraceae bacterium]|nr:amidase [Lachnospiraceae bacterium]
MKKVLGYMISLILVIGMFVPCVRVMAEEYEPKVLAVVDITEMSITELQQAVDEGFLTYEQIMRLYLDRIYAYADMYECLTQISDTAIEEAKRCDEIYKSSGRTSPLFGLPVIVKDNLDVCGMATTNGNKYLEEKLATEDADVIVSLKNAGAIIVAKANMDRYAEHSRYSISDYGRVNNAYDLTKSSYGSSGGSAVAAAASLAPICIGTDTNASIRVPSGANGVVGIRPTYGLLSRKGLTPCVVGRDTAGPIAKTVEDAAIILTALNDYKIDYTKALDVNALDGMRIGIIEPLWNFAVPSVREKLEEAVAVLEAQGAEIISMPISICDDWENGVGWYGPYFHQMMDQYDVDVAIHPTLWDEVKSHEVAYGSDSSCGCYVAPSAGVPSVSVPIGQNEAGLPYSMEFVARANDEMTMISAAYAFEQAKALNLKTPLAPNLYEVPETIKRLMELRDQPMYEPYGDIAYGTLYLDIETTYQAAVDYLDTPYYNDMDADATAEKLLRSYIDAITEYRFAELTDLRLCIWKTMYEQKKINSVMRAFENLTKK